MESLIPNDTAAPDQTAPNLELRFDQCREERSRGCKRQGCGQYRLQSDKARVANNDADRIGDERSRQISRVGLLKRNHARLLFERFSELFRPNVNGIDPDRAAREQDLRKPTRRSANVQGDAAIRIDAEMVEAMNQLEGGPRYPRIDGTADLDARAVGDKPAGLCRDLTVDNNRGVGDHRLRACAARRKAAPDQELVQSGPAQGSAVRTCAR